MTDQVVLLLQSGPFGVDESGDWHGPVNWGLFVFGAIVALVVLHGFESKKPKDERLETGPYIFVWFLFTVLIAGGIGLVKSILS